MTHDDHQHHDPHDHHGAGGADGSDEEAHGDVGSVSEEAAKLLGVLGDWAKEQGGSYAGAAASGAAGLGDALGDLDRHLATGAEECRYCPVCLVVAKVRATSPEIRHHLSDAATSLLAAVAGMLATPVPDDAGRRGPVERIDLGEDDDHGGTAGAPAPPGGPARPAGETGASPAAGETAEPFEDLLGPTRSRRTRRPCTDEEEPA